MNITVLGLTNPDVNLKRMHQLYNDISAATYHRLLKLEPNKSLVTCFLFHGQIYKLYYLQNLLIREY